MSLFLLKKEKLVWQINNFPVTNFSSTYKSKINLFLFLSLRLEGEETLKCRYFCRPPCAKVSYSNDHGCTWKVRFFCFRSEIPFLGIFGPKRLKLSVPVEIWYRN